MFTTLELLNLYSNGVMSMHTVMTISGIKSKCEFIEIVKIHQLPFALFLPDVRPMMIEEKEEFIKRYCYKVHK